MNTEKLHEHYIEFDLFLRQSKVKFENRLKANFGENANYEDFDIVRTIGTGTFGRVLLAKLKEDRDKFYAMKVMEKQQIIKKHQLRHTMCEIRLLDAVDFNFVINLDYYFSNNVYLFIVMPFIQGGEMFLHLRKMKRFDEALTKFYAAQVVLALEYLHYLGLVYRDLKPENILIDTDGYIKLADLGFCKKIDGKRTHTLCGTPEYIAPEIVLCQGYDKSVDYWSLGVLIFEMSAGYPPFYSKHPMQIYEKIVSGKYTCPPHFSKASKHLISNLLQVDRLKRFGILKNGIRDIKGHEWFENTDWHAILNRKLKTKFKPQIDFETDLRNFDDFDEEPMRKNSINEYAKEFSVIKI